MALALLKVSVSSQRWRWWLAKMPVRTTKANRPQTGAMIKSAMETKRVSVSRMTYTLVHSWGSQRGRSPAKLGTGREISVTKDRSIPWAPNGSRMLVGPKREPVAGFTKNGHLVDGLLNICKICTACAAQMLSFT